jgi:hypothetical protein
MFSRQTQLTIGSFDFISSYAPQPLVQQPLPRDELDFSMSGPYSDYNWELFYHMPFWIANALANNQQFEDARNWYQYIFNPEGDDMDDPDTGPHRATAPQKKYWITKPFFQTSVAEYTEQLLDEMMTDVAKSPDGSGLTKQLSLWVETWRANPFRPFAVARTRPVAFQMAIVLKYVKLHLEWGDSLFRQLTRESITQATQLYMTAAKILGPRPKTVPKAVETPSRTYNELGSGVDELSNALLDLENLIPDKSVLPHHGDELPSSPPLELLYFDIPPNDTMLQYWDLVDDRLFKIRHSQDINGTFVSLALTAPPIDPAAIIKALASGASLSNILQGFSAPLPFYRFNIMLDRAVALTNDVIRLGGSLLTMLQARDSEGLARLRGDLELQVLNQVTAVKQSAIQEAKDTIGALDAAKATAALRSSHYADLMAVFMDPLEILAVFFNADAIAAETNIQGAQNSAQTWHYVPTLSIGINGFGGSPSVSASWGGSNMAGAEGASAAVMQSQKAATVGAAASLQLMSNYLRRHDDWVFQKSLADSDGAQLDAQKTAATTHRNMLENDLAAHQKSIDSAITTNAFLANKYTNQELYQWNVQRITDIFFQSYNLAFGLAKKAERCFSHELADYSAQASFINYGHFDDLHSGLMSGEQLMSDIRRLETAYLDRNMRELEMSKNISLAQLDPQALLSLRTTGSATFAIPEAIFDLDCPGQYLRRIKTLSLSLPCVAGPLTSVSARLTLASNRYRASTALPSTQGTTALERYREQAGGADPRFVYNVGVGTMSVCTSTGSMDSGVLALALRDERYLPFEGCGAVGSLVVELPKVQQFDYASISDLVLHMSYTARDGGSALRKAVEEAQLELLAGMADVLGTEGLRIGYRLRQQMAGEWWALKKEATTTLMFGDVHLPFFASAKGNAASLKSVMWFVRGQFTPDQVSAGVVLLVNGVEVTVVDPGDGTGVLRGSSAGGAIKLNQGFTFAFKDPAALKVVDEIMALLWYTVKSS